MDISQASVKDTKLDIYLLAGQSNAQGSTSLEDIKEEDRDLNQYPNVRYYSTGQYVTGEDRGIHRDYCAVREGLGYNSTRIGPELGMARVLNDRYATSDRKALIIKVASGGVSLLIHEAPNVRLSEATQKRFDTRGSWYPETLENSGDTNPDRPTGYLTRLFKKTVSEVYAELLFKGFTAENIRLKAFCWMQGEEDRGRVQQYYTVFPIFAQEIRGFLSTVTGKDYSKLPIIMGEISETSTGADETNVEKNRAFIQMQRKLAADDSTITLLPLSSYAVNKIVNGESVTVGSNLYHWNYHDMLEIGELFGNAAYGAN